MKKLLLLLLFSCFLTWDADAQKAAKRGTVCGDPTAACASRSDFNDDDIPFAHGGYAVAESERFYAVILQSYNVDLIENSGVQDGCEVGPPDTERVGAQSTFKKNKVFFARGCYSIMNSFYTNIGDKVIALAAYAGRTKAEANRFLATVKKTGYKDAYLKRITTGFNGT